MVRTAKMRQNDKTTNDKKPFSGFRILGASFLILYIYYNIYNIKYIYIYFVPFYLHAIVCSHANLKNPICRFVVCRFCRICRFVVLSHLLNSVNGIRESNGW